MNRKILLALVLMFNCFVVVSAQEKTDKKDKVVGEVSVTATKANVEPNYIQLRKLSENANAFRGKYASVNSLVLKARCGDF